MRSKRTMMAAIALALATACVLLPAGVLAAGSAPEITSAAETPGVPETGSASETPAVPDEAEITVFAAKSLNGVLEELIDLYQKSRPGITVLGSYDSSGTLMTQIEEGAPCDVFFSAAQKQMNELEEKGLLVPDTRADVVNNQVCVVTFRDSGTKVTGLDTLGEAASIALADGSVPVGRYTRVALMNAGILPEAEDPSAFTTEEVSEALGGVAINECANVGAVAAAVAEGANEAGTVYLSDIHGFEDDLVVLETVPYELTGNVIYPVSGVVNPEAGESESAAAEDFIRFLLSDEAKAVFEAYGFDTNVG